MQQRGEVYHPGDQTVACTLWMKVLILLFPDLQRLLFLTLHGRKHILFTEFENVASYLIYSKILNVIRKFNLQRHYDTSHANEYDKLKDDDRIAMVEQYPNLF